MRFCFRYRYLATAPEKTRAFYFIPRDFHTPVAFYWRTYAEMRDVHILKVKRRI